MKNIYKLVHNEDLDVIIEFNKNICREDPENDNNFKEEEFALNWQKNPIDSQPSGDIIICMEGEQVVGRIDVMYEMSYVDFSTIGYIDWIYVRPSYRGKGIGKRLLVEAEKLFQMKQCEKYYLFIAENNRAKIFYDSTNLEIGTKRTGVKHIKNN